ncbi:hypothetical protein ACJJIF_10730 [Microbulbifer sp. SSSA002]|uniref:hypothetical protein n=1 Tax=unclassified Microbulbifer TaxID=2619833 RepID=UPI004039B606
MRIFLIITVLLLVGCIDHHSESSIQADNLRIAVQSLYSENGAIGKEKWPTEISELNPASVRASDQGLYVVLQEFFSSESGIFLPLDGIEVSTEEGRDPSYKQIGKGIYSYVIKG